MPRKSRERKIIEAALNNCNEQLDSMDKTREQIINERDAYRRILDRLELTGGGKE